MQKLAGIILKNPDASNRDLKAETVFHFYLILIRSIKKKLRVCYLQFKQITSFKIDLSLLSNHKKLGLKLTIKSRSKSLLNDLVDLSPLKSILIFHKKFQSRLKEDQDLETKRMI